MIKDNSNFMSDDTYLKLISNGDKEAYTALYKKYWEKLYISAYTILKNNHMAEDIVQEVMISLWLRRKDLQIENLNAYLHQSTRFQIFKTIRKNNNMPLTSLDMIKLSIPNDAESNLKIEEINNSLKKTISELPSRCQEIYILRRTEGLTVKEISLRLGLSPKTVENQLTIAFNKIRKQLDNQQKYSATLISFIIYGLY